MSNVLLTEICNRRCPYCFAQHAMARGDARTMSLAEVVRVADLLVASRAARVGILGGEPTLHPDFVDILPYLLSRGLRATVFTNGLASEETVAALSAIAPGAKVTYVVNVNYPEITPSREAARQEAGRSTASERSQARHGRAEATSNRGGFL